MEKATPPGHARRTSLKLRTIRHVINRSKLPRENHHTNVADKDYHKTQAFPEYLFLLHRDSVRNSSSRDISRNNQSIYLLLIYTRISNIYELT